VLLVVALVAVFNGGDKPAGEPFAGAGPLARTPTAVPSPTPAKTSTRRKPTEPPVAFTGVNVRIRVTGRQCWVRVRDARTSAELFQGVLRRGQIKEFKAAQKLALEFGDAGAVRLVVNGRNVGAPGRAGDVVRVVFGPGDPAAG
jgi:hypothetical protein